MEEHHNTVDTSKAGSRKTLSRKQLTWALILITLIPFGLVVLLYWTMPAIEDPVLDVTVQVGPRAWTSDSGSEVRLVPCVIVANPTAEVWRNLNMSINDQFHFFHPEPIAAGEEVFVPLKFFHTKGNAYFPPESQELKKLTVYAQIPSGARAIVEIDGSELMSRRD